MILKIPGVCQYKPSFMAVGGNELDTFNHIAYYALAHGEPKQMGADCGNIKSISLVVVCNINQRMGIDFRCTCIFYCSCPQPFEME